MIRSGWTRLSNGLRLDHDECGDASGTPLLLLHGVTDSKLSYAPLLPRLPSGLRAIALSQRGHGDSDRPQAGYRPADFADDLAAFMDARGIARAVVVGHSMGGSVALRFALAHPDRLLGLVLIGAAASWRGHPDITAMWRETLADLTDPVDAGFVRAFQESTLARPVAPDFLDAVVEESLKLPARVWRQVFREGVLGADDATGLGRITAPTLVLWGDRDELTRNRQPALREEIPRARHRTHAGGGHALHWEDPSRCAAEIGAFAAALQPAELVNA